MEKNSIALAFENFGIGSHPQEWYLSDWLKAYYPEMFENIINSNCSEYAEKLIEQLQNQIATSSSDEAQVVIDWLQGLRGLRDDGDLRSGSERPGMNRGFVTE